MTVPEKKGKQPPGGSRDDGKDQLMEMPAQSCDKGFLDTR